MRFTNFEGVSDILCVLRYIKEDVWKNSFELYLSFMIQLCVDFPKIRYVRQRPYLSGNFWKINFPIGIDAVGNCYTPVMHLFPEFSSTIYCRCNSSKNAKK